MSMSDGEITDEIQAVRVEGQRQYRKDGYWWLVMVATVVMSAGGSIAFSTINTNESERKFCAIVATSILQAQQRIDTYAAAPPTTDAGRAQEAQAVTSLDEFTRLQRELDCPLPKDD